MYFNATRVLWPAISRPLFVSLHLTEANMRSTLPVVLLTFIGSSLAFPANADKSSVEPAGCPFAAKNKRQADALPLAAFDPVKQKVDVTGDHAFQPPKAGDKRVSRLHHMAD